MKRSFRLLLASTALLALPAVVRAGEEAECPALAAKSAKATAAAPCCASQGQYVLVRVKGDTAALGKLLAKVEGITAADTCCETKFTKVTYNKDKVCSDKVLAAIKDAGYTIESQRVTYAVDGLSCGACSDKVTTALSKVSGVSEAKVCHESKQAVVDFDPNKISADKIVAAIDATGFKAAPVVN